MITPLTLFSCLPGKKSGSVHANIYAVKTGFFIWLLLCFSPVYAQPTLVKDINTKPLAGTFNPGNLVQSNGILYFSGNDSSYGQELWRSDGTTAGTFMLKDINPGLVGSNPSNLLDVNGIVYFVANRYNTKISDYTFTGGYQIWKTDGTLAGTQLVTEVEFGTWETEEGGPAPIVLTKAGNTIFYSSGNNAYNYTLISTRGGAINIENSNEDEEKAIFTEIGNALYISGSTSQGLGLIKTDGTEAGTSLIKSGFSRNLTNVNGTLFFTVADPINGQQLWKSNGTEAGTVLVKNIPGVEYSFLFKLTAMDGTLYFAAGSVLWKSDGTPEGTVIIKEFASGSYGFSLTAVNKTLFIIADFSTGGNSVWKSDGTTAGTTLVQDFGQEDEVVPMTGSGNIFYFLIYEQHPSNNFSLWRSDGSTTGTFKLMDFTPLYGIQQIESYADLNGTLFFAPSYNGLWKSDGTVAGTVKINVSLSSNTTSDSQPRYIMSTANSLYFGANDGIYGDELWKSDGTAAGTFMVKDINPGLATADIQYITEVNPVIYFSARDSLHGRELWKSDGTEAGTILVKDINPGIFGADIKNLIQVNGTLFFIAYHPMYGWELWKSNGTEAGTVLVKDIIPGTEYYDFSGDRINNLTLVNNTLFFTVNHPDYGSELWKSDGTAAGTFMVKDINSGMASSSPHNLTSVNGTLFFSAYTPASGLELWKSDGTQAGTVLVKDIAPGSDDTYPEQFIAANGILYFIAYNPTGFRPSIWKSDGTTAGTTLFREFPSGITSRDLTYVNGNFYFFNWYNVDYWGIGSADLWKIEASPEGEAIKLKENFKGDLFSNPIFNSNGILYFIMDDGIYGKRLWRSDGTPEGTALLDPQLSPFSQLTILNNTLYFSAYTSNTGIELWKYNPEACTSPQTTNLSVAGNTVCSGENGTITLTNSQANVRYQAYVNHAPLGLPVMGGGNITLSIPAVSLSVGINKLTISATGCITTALPDTAIITVTVQCDSVVCAATGSILQELWLNVPGSLVSDIPLSTPPSASYQLSSFESKTNQGNNYGERIRGYLCAPQNGTYTFYIAGDDRCELWLSADDDPSKKVKIASVPYYTGVREWTKYPAQKSIPIALQAGKKYYIEALHKEGSYTDNLAVGWQRADSAAITVIQGDYLSPYIPKGEGRITREYWANVTGSLVTDIPLTTPATSVTQITTLETPTNAANNYGQRIRGYVHPQVSGNYRFFVAGDDRCELWLSSDEDPSKKTKIASVPYYTGVRQWDKYASQQSASIYLVAGRKYYIEALHKEGPYSDNLAVAWQAPDQTAIIVIPGKYLSPFSASPAVARVGVEESAANQVSLYPNPFESKITIRGSLQGKLSITITDNVGRTVYQSSEQTETELNLAHLKQGLYIVKVSTEEGSTIIQKVVKR